MGLSAEEKKERENKLSELKITKNEDGKRYVFVSYKSDNWRKVFMEKVIPLQKEGMRVYADKNFDEINDSWLKAMQEHIEDASVFLMFLSKEYMRSYATLIELLTAVKNKTVIVLVVMGDRKKMYNELMSDGETRKSLEMRTNEINYLKSLLANLKKSGPEDLRASFEELHTVLTENNATFRVKDVVKMIDKILDEVAPNENDFDMALSSLKSTIEHAVKQNREEWKKSPVFEDVVESAETTKKLRDTKSSNDGSKKTEEKPIVKSTVSQAGGSLTIDTIREKMSTPEIAEAFRKERETMPFGGKGAMDYAMASVLGGCNAVTAKSPAYQLNYYVYDVATLDKDKKAKPESLGATWTWSSNCRKVLGLEKSGPIPTEYDAYFKELPGTTSIEEMKQKFLAGMEAPYGAPNTTKDGKSEITEKKRQLILTAFEKIENFF